MNLDDFDTDNIVLTRPMQETITRDDSLWKNLQYRGFISDMCSGALSEENEKKFVELLREFGEYPSDEYLHPLILEFSNIMTDEASRTWQEQIGLRVVSEDHMPYRNSKPDCSYNKTDFPTEYYGYYDSYNNAIVVCPERIMKAPEELEKQCRHISSRELYVVVLVHALAHALMDPTREDGMSNKYQPMITVKNGFSKREVLMEESLANMITLQYFAKLGKPDVVRFGEVREFIELQPLPYSFGIDQFYLLNQPDWRPWRKAKRSTKFIIDKK